MINLVGALGFVAVFYIIAVLWEMARDRWWY